jgi:chemotaxis protein histidine kinase CheA
MLPLSDRNPHAVIKHVVHAKSNTALCSHVKVDSKCKKSGCAFAHSVEDLILPFPVGQVSLEAKRVMAEQIVKKKIPDFFMNPSHMNSEYLDMMKKQVDMVDDLRQQETGEILNEEDEKNIEDFLKEIEKEEEECSKEEFLAELELLDQFEDYFEENEIDESEESDENDENDEEDNESETKVKIVVKSISNILEWEKIKKENGEIGLWGDDDDEKW